MVGAKEVILIEADRSACTVSEGPGGFLHFKQWTWNGREWAIEEEFVLGAYGVSPLQTFLAMRGTIRR